MDFNLNKNHYINNLVVQQNPLQEQISPDAISSWDRFITETLENH